MGRTVRLGELLLGTEGAALFRGLLEGSDEFIEGRVEAIRQLVAGFDGDRLSAGLEVTELDVGEGYAAWAPIYDAMSNGLIRAEAPLVASVTSDLPIGVALDAACGTGRHAEWLSAAGHATTGIDASPAMLDVARRRIPTAQFRIGDLTRLPVDDGSFDFVICALALTHLENPGPAIHEIARVARCGGRIVIADAHPTFVLIQGQALFPRERGLAFVRNYPHLVGTYLRAFRAAGLAVIDCIEAPMQADFTTGIFAGAADAAAALWNDIPAVVIWSLNKTR
jgi:ubiquinone/menaquinone biosynthesis C-methylase UbiE